MITPETAEKLRRIKREELRNLSDAEALRSTEMLLSMPDSLVWRADRRRESRGLLERQRLLYGKKVSR